MMPTNGLATNGILLMIAAAFLFSLMGALTKSLGTHLPFMEIVFFRGLTTLICLLPYMYRKHIPLIGPNKFWLFVRSFSGFIALSLAFFVTTKIPLADAALLNHTSIIFVAILSIPFLKEKISRRLGVLIALSFIGALLVIKPGFHYKPLYGFMGLISGLFAGIAYVVIKKLHGLESFLTMVFDFSLVTVCGSLIYAVVEPWHQPNSMDLLNLALLGLSGTGAQLLMTYSYKFAPASVISPFQFSGVLFSAGWGALFWHEWPDIFSVLGGAIIIACGVGILRINKRLF